MMAFKYSFDKAIVNSISENLYLLHISFGSCLNESEKIVSCVAIKTNGELFESLRLSNLSFLTTKRVGSEILGLYITIFYN